MTANPISAFDAVLKVDVHSIIYIGAPLIKATVAVGKKIFSNEDDIFARLDQRVYGYPSVRHNVSEYARDDSEGFHESISIRGKGSGRCCDHDFDHTVAFTRRAPLYLGFLGLLRFCRKLLSVNFVTLEIKKDALKN